MVHPSRGNRRERRPPATRPSIEERWALVSNAADKSLEETLVIAFLGSASSGKDSAIRALFGIDFGDIDPIPGSTEPRAGRGGRPEGPRAGGERARVRRPARRGAGAGASGSLDQLDLAVYLVNCDGGATIDEKRDLDGIRALGRPVLVCLNKIDLIRPAQRENFVRATLVQLGVPQDMAVVTAFDPLPQLAEAPIGVDQVIAWIHRTSTAGGKALLFAKNAPQQGRGLRADHRRPPRGGPRWPGPSRSPAPTRPR